MLESKPRALCLCSNCTMLQFHAYVHGAHPSGSSVPAPLPITFELAACRLESLDRMFLEPDGSFVWVGTAADGGAWQVDGNLIDRGDTLAHVELKGTCPEDRFGDILRCLGWPEFPLLFQLVRQGIHLDEAAFRAWAASDARASYG
jgi:hypothetical protein